MTEDSKVFILNSESFTLDGNYLNMDRQSNLKQKWLCTLPDFEDGDPIDIEVFRTADYFGKHPQSWQVRVRITDNDGWIRADQYFWSTPKDSKSPFLIDRLSLEDIEHVESVLKMLKSIEVFPIDLSQDQDSFHPFPSYMGFMIAHDGRHGYEAFMCTANANDMLEGLQKCGKTLIDEQYLRTNFFETKEEAKAKIKEYALAYAKAITEAAEKL